MIRVQLVWAIKSDIRATSLYDLRLVSTTPRNHIVSSSFTCTHVNMPHATATFNGRILAEADNYETVEGNVYFPPSSIQAKDALTDATLTTVCPWKGTASYYNISVDGKSDTRLPAGMSAHSCRQGSRKRSMVLPT